MHVRTFVPWTLPLTKKHHLEHASLDKWVRVIGVQLRLGLGDIKVSGQISQEARYEFESRGGSVPLTSCGPCRS